MKTVEFNVLTYQDVGSCHCPTCLQRVNKISVSWIDPYTSSRQEVIVLYHRLKSLITSRHFIQNPRTQLWRRQRHGRTSNGFIDTSLCILERPLFRLQLGLGTSPGPFDRSRDGVRRWCPATRLLVQFGRNVDVPSALSGLSGSLGAESCDGWYP